jgi:deoxyribonuclease-4
MRPPTSTGTRRHCLGAHLSIAGGMHRALEAALRLGCDAVQVFVKNQRQWRAAALGSADLERWHALLAAGGLARPIAHATYLINLAAPDRRLYARSRAAFAEELLRCERLGIRYLVVHPGAAGGAPRTRALARVSAALDRVLSQYPALRTMPLLETTAGQGTALGSSFDELAEIIAGVEEPQRLGICIDTCHVFAAGNDIRRAEGYQDMISRAARTVGLERIRCWHMNDSRCACGARVDRHAHIGQGKLGRAAFANVLGDPRFIAVPMILETPKGSDARGRDYDALNLRRLRAIAARAVRSTGSGTGARGRYNGDG